MKIKLSTLEGLVNSMNYENAGDSREREFGSLIIDTFSNSEIFWKRFVCPATNRVDVRYANSPDGIKFRNGVDKDIEEIGSFHYSVFLNLVYANSALETKQMSFFENFYTHLASVCDSTEELMTKLYLLSLECNNLECEVLQRLSKRKFTAIAQEWYDNHYSATFEHYLSKGKHPPVKLIGRTNILEEYFQNHKPWQEFKRNAQLIRQYRNAIVHNYQIGSIQFAPGQFFVPKKGKIQNYKKWNLVFKALNYPSKLSSDFVLRENQMEEDIRTFKEVLQNLWEKPINDLNQLLYKNKNSLLLGKYSLFLVE